MDTTQVPEAERNDPYVLSPEEAAEIVAGHPWSRFVVVGDSVAAGIGDPTEGYRNASWAERVADALVRARPDLTYVNLGRRNRTAAQVRESQLGAALELEPDLAAVCAGGNDLLVEPFDIAPVKAVLDEMVVAFQERGATAMTFELMDLPGAFGAGFEELDRRLRLLNGAAREISEERGTIHVDNYSEPWAREKWVFSADLQHATMRGQACAAGVAIRAIGDHLRRAGR